MIEVETKNSDDFFEPKYWSIAPATRVALAVFKPKHTQYTEIYIG
jgi:hypothetical protein